MEQSRLENVRFRKYVNYFLLAVGLTQLSLTAYLKLSRSSEAPNTKSAVSELESKRKMDLAAVAPIPVYAPAAPAILEKNQKQIEVEVQRDEEVVPVARALPKKRAHRIAHPRKVHKTRTVYHAPAPAKGRERVARKASASRKIASTTAQRRTAKKTARRGIASRNASDESLESVLGKDAIRTSNELIAENDGLLPRDRQSIARELGIRDSEFRRIWRKEQELKKKLRRADASGSTGLRRILLSDHRAWMREYLGENKYERYMELSR